MTWGPRLGKCFRQSPCTSMILHIYDRSNVESEVNRTQQIIRYRETATLRRPQIKQYTASNGGWGLQNQREHHKIKQQIKQTKPNVCGASEAKRHVEITLFVRPSVCHALLLLSQHSALGLTKTFLQTVSSFERAPRNDIWTSESPRAHVANFYGRFRLIRFESITFFRVKIVSNCNIVGHLHHPF